MVAILTCPQYVNTTYYISVHFSRRCQPNQLTPIFRAPAIHILYVASMQAVVWKCSMAYSAIETTDHK